MNLKKNLPILILLFFASCKKLTVDQLAFPSSTTEKYELENYDAGEQSVPAAYDIPVSNRTILTFTSIDKSTGETYKIYGLYIGNINTIAQDTILLYCHGQSLNMDIYYPRTRLLAHLNETVNRGVLMFDFRGYGMSEGTPDEAGLAEDMDAAINWLIAKNANPSNVIYYGYSLGCIPVIDRAAYRTDFQPKKIILESPLASVENLANSSTIINLHPAFISNLRFNNAEKIKDVKVPLLWIHGVEDDYIAIENGELVYQNHQGTYKKAIRVENAKHGDIPKIMGYTTYLEAIHNFLLN
ncbi:hypothetical protein DNU06_01110 [Putridiphycobacter roseus]|uniref:AB hydrolase-1 domain-containing protein n=1 Tax=Putridiphycobacter roseus TaxID=2219161 RepID=A0A2W1NS40_9FLAO|nr:alpha/beta hydrolase [Putridiphycobacter roseus]PZE18462.1 hypothetical protein DNU06_01110 [Putridiphycobacter roseus]